MQPPSRVLLVTAAAAISIVSGCAVTEKVYLQDASVTSPAGLLPIHIADQVTPNHLTLTPMVSFGGVAEIKGQASGHSKVNSAGVYAVDTLHNSDGSISYVPGSNTQTYAGDNLRWHVPSFAAGLSFDLPLTRSFALDGGLLYTSGGHTDLWGGHAGIGLIREGESVGFRCDAGLQWTPVWYSVWSVTEYVYSPLFSSSSYSRAVYYYDEGSSAPFGWYLGFTINARNPSWIVRPFVSCMVMKQGLVSVSPHDVIVNPFGPVNNAGVTGSNVEASALLFSLSPGIAVPLSERDRILIGVRAVFFPGSDGDASLSGTSVVFPFVQCDIGL